MSKGMPWLSWASYSVKKSDANSSHLLWAFVLLQYNSSSDRSPLASKSFFSHHSSFGFSFAYVSVCALHDRE